MPKLSKASKAKILELIREYAEACEIAALQVEYGYGSAVGNAEKHKEEAFKAMLKELDTL